MKKLILVMLIFPALLMAGANHAGSSDYIITQNYLADILPECDSGHFVIYFEFKTTSQSNDGIIGSGNTNSYADFEITLNLNKSGQTTGNYIGVTLGLKGSSGIRFDIHNLFPLLYSGDWHSVFFAMSDDSVYAEYNHEFHDPDMQDSRTISGLTMNDDLLLGFATTGGSFNGSMDDVFIGWVPNGTDLHAFSAALEKGDWKSFEGVRHYQYYDHRTNPVGTATQGDDVEDHNDLYNSTVYGDGVTFTIDGEGR
jgi:hypothetical protein